MDHSLSQLNQEQNSAGARELNRAWKTLYTQFERIGELGDLEKAIKNIQRALSLAPDGHPDKPMYLNNLGISFKRRFERRGMLNDLEKAINSGREAISLTPDNHPNKPMYLNTLGCSFGSRFGRTGMLSDLEEAIKYQRYALSFTPDDHPSKPMYLNNLGNSFESRFGRTGTLSDLDEAIDSQRQAISLIPGDHPDRPMYLNNLGNSLDIRFEHTGTLSDIEEAIDSQRQAISLTPDGHPCKSSYLSNLGISLGSQFGRTGMLSDIEEAIEIQRQAVSLTPDDHPDKPMCLNNLGNAMESQFERTGMLSDIEEAIRSKRQAVSLIPDNHPDKPMYLNNLGSSLHTRFERTGMLSDIQEVIESQRQAVFLTPDDHPDKPMCLNNLGIFFESRFGRTGMLSDLDEAIDSQRQAIALTPDGHPGISSYLSNLGVSFESRFGRTGLLSDLEEAIDSQRQAISLAPDGHPGKPSYFNNLGVAFESRFGRTKIPSDLEEAIRSKRQAVSLTPDNHPDKLMYLINLGSSFESRFQSAGFLDDFDNAISNFQLAASSNIGAILLRCHAFQRCAHLQAERDPSSALIAYSQAINLLPQVAWIGDPIATRHSQLTNLGDISREAAAFALDVGRPDLALEWLEQGRSVVWNQLLRLRISADDFDQAHPDLCAEFTRISRELQSAATRGHDLITSDNIENPTSLEEETQRHHRLAEKWDSLMQEIRSLPNFQDFLLPKKVSALMEAASLGPVVVINVHERRCDALVLNQGRDKVLHIPLKTLHYNNLTKMYTSLRQYLANPHRARRWEETRAGRPAQPISDGSLIVDILEQIYSNVVYPILQALDMTTPRPDSSDLPRIWWCPTGPLTFFPLHAACRTTEARVDGTFNYVVSSYTPTINALLEARSGKHRPFNQLFGIAMTDTPNQTKLPGAGTEIARIQKLFAADSRWSFEILRNEQATGEQVLTRMANSSWIHLACHAIQDKKEPTQSGFCLHDRRLTIMDIVAKPFGHADLAFLSACQTATGDENASDEAIHITSAMLGAGYRNVIGTMWSIPDEAASKVAVKVYTALLSGGEPDSSRAAQALHDAVKELRMSDHGSHTFWVPFVHYGA